MSTISTIIDDSRAAARKQNDSNQALREACIDAVVAEFSDGALSAKNAKLVRNAVDSGVIEPAELEQIRSTIGQIGELLGVTDEERALYEKAAKLREEYVNYRDRYRETLKAKGEAASAAEGLVMNCRQAIRQLGEFRKDNPELYARVVARTKQVTPAPESEAE